MFNRFATGTIVIGGIMVIGDGVTIIAARGGTATAVTATTDMRHDFTAGAAVGAVVITIITTTVIIELTDGGVSRRLSGEK